MGDDMDFEYTPSFSSSCGLSKTVRDCDGDYIELCQK